MATPTGHYFPGNVFTLDEIEAGFGMYADRNTMIYTRRDWAACGYRQQPYRTMERSRPPMDSGWCICAVYHPDRSSGSLVWYCSEGART